MSVRVDNFSLLLNLGKRWFSIGRAWHDCSEWFRLTCFTYFCILRGRWVCQVWVCWFWRVFVGKGEISWKRGDDLGREAGCCASGCLGRWSCCTCPIFRIAMLQALPLSTETRFVAAQILNVPLSSVRLRGGSLIPVWVVSFRNRLFGSFVHRRFTWEFGCGLWGRMNVRARDFLFRTL